MSSIGEITADLRELKDAGIIAGWQLETSFDEPHRTRWHIMIEPHRSITYSSQEARAFIYGVNAARP